MKAEAKLIASFLPEVNKVKSSEYHFQFGRIVFWDCLGKDGINKIIKDKYTIGDIPILFGMAGALSPDVKIGSAFAASCLKSFDVAVSILMPAHKDFPTCNVYTSDSAVTDNNHRQELFEKTKCEIVEMEGIYFAQYFKTIKQKSYIFRVVSDTYNKGFEIPFCNEIKHGAKKIANEIKRIFML